MREGRRRRYVGKSGANKRHRGSAPFQPPVAGAVKGILPRPVSIHGPHDVRAKNGPSARASWPSTTAFRFMTNASHFLASLSRVRAALTTSSVSVVKTYICVEAARRQVSLNQRQMKKKKHLSVVWTHQGSRAALSKSEDLYRRACCHMQCAWLLGTEISWPRLNERRPSRAKLRYFLVKPKHLAQHRSLTDNELPAQLAAPQYCSERVVSVVEEHAKQDKQSRTREHETEVRGLPWDIWEDRQPQM
jgi:hypothetical protein